MPGLVYRLPLSLLIHRLFFVNYGYRPGDYITLMLKTDFIPFVKFLRLFRHHPSVPCIDAFAILP